MEVDIRKRIKISGFTYVRDGFKYGYPFIASIKSLLTIVDDLVVVVGDSSDGTREAIDKIFDPRITIIDSVWDEENRRDGSIFAIQTNIALKYTKGDWAVHIQADEVLHEDDAKKIRSYIEQVNGRDDIDALLFPFLHFWGDYEHIRDTRRVHPYEIRAFRKSKPIFSYRDSQGFRGYTSYDRYCRCEEGTKLRALKTDIRLFHYSYCRNPKLLKKKFNYAQRFWHDDKWLEAHTSKLPFDFNKVDKLEVFTGEHPKYMEEIITQKDWDFVYDPSKSNMKFTDKILAFIEKITHKRLFSFQNYKMVKKL